MGTRKADICLLVKPALCFEGVEFVFLVFLEDHSRQPVRHSFVD